MIKFRTWYDNKIEEVEVVRETAKYVTLADGQRWMKRTNYFNSWQEAKDFLIDREKTAIVKLLNEIKGHQETLKKIEEMHQ